jgi:hypothetical protein
MNAAVTHPDPLKGWAYVLAIDEDQVNKGLVKAYEGQNMGRLMPPLPKDQLELSLDRQGGLKLRVTLGCPRITTVETGLNRCELTLPLLDAALADREGPVGLGADAVLVITTSLSSVKSHVGEAGPAGAGGPVQHTAYVDILAPEAAYAVRLSGRQPKDLLDDMAEALKAALQKYARHTYRVGGFVAPAEANPFVPDTLAFTFVKNAGVPARNAIVFCAGISPKTEEERRKTVQYDNRLRFGTEILPKEVPAALWVGSSIIMEKLMLPMLQTSLASGGAKPALVFDGEATALASFLEMAPVQGRRAVMQGFKVWPDKGRMAMETVVRVFGVRGRIDAVATIRGHLDFGLTNDHTAFYATSHVDSNTIQTINNNPWWLRVVSYIVTLGITRAIEAGVEKAIRNRMSGPSYQQMDVQLKAATTKISEVAAHIPGLENLTAGGHLVFDSVSFMPGGTAYLGIRGTGVAPSKG